MSQSLSAVSVPISFGNETPRVLLTTAEPMDEQDRAIDAVPFPDFVDAMAR